MGLYSQTQSCDLYQRAFVAAAVIDRDSYKLFDSEKVIAVLEIVKKTRVLYSISEKACIITDFENLKAHFGLNLSAKD